MDGGGREGEKKSVRSRKRHREKLYIIKSYEFSPAAYHIFVSNNIALVYTQYQHIHEYFGISRILEADSYKRGSGRQRTQRGLDG